MCSGGQVVMHLLIICLFSCYLGSSVQSSSVKDSVKPSLSTNSSLRRSVVTGRDIKHQMSTPKSGPTAIETPYPDNFPSTNDDSVDSIYGTVYTGYWRTDWEKVHDCELCSLFLIFWDC